MTKNKIRRYIIIEKENKELINKHFEYCKEHELPNISIEKMKGKYSYVLMDNINLKQEITDFIKENYNDNFFVVRTLMALGIVKKEEYTSSQIGNTSYSVYILDEYAEKLADYLFEIHYAAIREFNKKIKSDR